MDVRLFAAALCCLLVFAHGAVNADDDCSLPPDAAPVDSRAALDAWLQRCPSPLRHMTPGARGRFLDSLDFNERGVTRLPTGDLSNELTREEIAEVFALLGLPASSAPAGISREEAERLRDAAGEAAPGRGASDAELRFNALYYASMTNAGDDAGTVITTLYDALFPADGFPAEIAEAPVHDVRLMYQAALLASWNGYRADHVAAAAQTLAALEERGIATTEELTSMHQVLVRAGQFDASRRFALRHATAGLTPLPPLREPVPVADHVPSIVRLSESGDALIHEAADLGSLRIVVVAGPGCPYSRAAAQAIAQDPELGPVFQDHALWLASPGQMDSLRVLQRWNDAYPAAALVIAASHERWPMLELDTVPQFHMFRDGELMASVTGWPVEEGNRDAVLAALREAEMPAGR